MLTEEPLSSSGNIEGMRRFNAAGIGTTTKVVMNTIISRGSSSSSRSGAARDRMAAVCIVKPQVDLKAYRYIYLENGLRAIAVHDPEMRELANRSQREMANSVDSNEEEEDEDEDEDSEEDLSCEDSDEGSDVGDSQDIDKRAAGKASAISAKTTKKAAAALCVNVGSLSDSKDMQGLAHFLEHMLFMGSKKYPIENEYDSFLTDHGGSSNAFTEAETTTFYFSVNHEFLDDSLDRFAQFFIEPLVPEDSLQREVQAVESEFRQAVTDDTARLMQLQSYTAPTGHPMSGFMWGNEKSLSKIPLLRGVSPRDELLKLYKENYTAERMCLCVIGAESLDELEEMIERNFRQVRFCSGSPMPERHLNPYSSLAQKYGNNILREKTIFWVESVKDQRLLNFSWSLPSLDDKYLKKPSEYLSHLIGHEGENSLLSALKKKQWAMELCAGVGESSHDKNSLSYLFSVQISLTKLGLQEWEKVVAATFCYLGMLMSAGPQQWVYEELRDIFNMQFQFQEEEDFDEFAVDIANNLRLVDPSHVLYKDHVFQEFDASLIRDCLALLSPQRLRIDICTKASSNLVSEYQMKEEWFGVQYSEESFSMRQQDLWESAYKSKPDSVPGLSGLKLGFPPRNLFIPTDFSIVNAQSFEKPVIVFQNSRIRIWHKVSVGFNTPRASLLVSIYSPSFSSSLRSAVLAEIFVKLLRDSLTETLYMASVADIEAAISCAGGRIEVSVAGFSHKIFSVLEVIVSGMFDLKIREDRLAVIIEELQRNYANSGLKPLSQASLSRLHLLRGRSFHPTEKSLSLSSPVSLFEITDAVNTFLSDYRVEALFLGNVNVEHSLLFSEFLTKHPTFGKECSGNLSFRPDINILKLNTGVTVLGLPSNNPKEDNSVVEEYYQIKADSVRDKAMVDLLESLMSEPLFNELRTKQQLGYTVDCSARNTHGLLGFIIRVQSSSKDPLYLSSAVEDFVVNIFTQYLQGLPDSRFLEHKASLQATKMHKDLCLADEASRIWEEVWEGRYAFDAKIEEAQALDEISKEDVIQLVKNFLTKSGSGYRNLSTQIFVNAEWDSLNGSDKSTIPQNGLTTLRSRLHGQPSYWPELAGRSKAKADELKSLTR